MGTMKNLVVALLLALPFAATASAQTTLRWKFAPEQKFQVACHQNTEVTTSISGKAQKAYLEMTMELDWEVDDVANDVATITQSFTRLAIKTSAPQADAISYDTSSATQPTGAAKELAAGIKPLIGAKFTVKMDARGDVKEVHLTDEAQQALTALPADSQLKQVLSPAGLTQLFRLGGGVLPEQAVSAGDTWQAPSQTETPYGKLSQETTFTYNGPSTIAGQILHKISMASTGEFAPKADAVVKIEIKEQTTSGQMLFDSEAGYVTTAETKLVSKSARVFRDNLIQATVESTTKLTIKRQ